MGMSIDESISIFKNKGKYSLTEKENEAKRIAIDTMRKYQKIEQIANDKDINGDLLRMSEIRWVLKNGNDD